MHKSHCKKYHDVFVAVCTILMIFHFRELVLNSFEFFIIMKLYLIYTPLRRTYPKKEKIDKLSK